MSEDRHAQILVLLATRFEHLPEPVRQTSYAAPGFVHNVDAHVTCPDCFGELPARNGCEGCHGAGYLVERRRRDPYAVERTLPYGLDVGQHERRRDLDAAIGRLEQQLRPPWASAADELADANQHPYGWEHARRLMYERFDYRALDVALDVLHAAWPGVAASSARGLAFVDPRMPTPIRAPVERSPASLPARGRAAHPDDRAERDREILELAHAGASYAEIVDRFGLSARQLRRIVNGSLEAA